MTFEELKAEAKRQGYNLIKKKESVKLLPCTCGRKRLYRWLSTYGEQYRCPICNNSGDWGTTQRIAKRNWNNAEWRYRNEKI